MTARKFRQPVVFDTNIFVRSFKARAHSSHNRRAVRLCLLEKQLQLILSPELMEEYLKIFESILGFNTDLIAAWQQRFEDDSRTTMVKLGRRFNESRDNDDNIVLATAFAGRADYLITNDRDLLELPQEFLKTLPFEIVTPQRFFKNRESN